MQVERYRLFTSARKVDRLKNIHRIEYIYKFLEKLKKKPVEKVIFQFNFSLRKWREDHCNSLYNSIKFGLENYCKCDVSEKFYSPNVKTLEVKTNPELANSVLDVITETNHYNYAQVCIVGLYTPEKREVSWCSGISLVSGNGNYYKKSVVEKLTKFVPVKIEQIEKIPYRNGTTVENEEEINWLKKNLCEYLDDESPTAEILFRDCMGNRVAFERVKLPGSEDHLRWRRKVGEVFEEVRIRSKEDLRELIKNDDAFSLYPAVQGEIKHSGKLMKIKTKFVMEFDTPNLMRKNRIGLAAKVADTIQQLFKELRIPTLYLHSGSRSARSQCFIDYYSILENLESVKRDFPFIGIVGTKEIRKPEELYNIVIKCFERCLGIEILEKLKKKDLLFTEVNEKVVPTITFNKRGELRPISILIDRPLTVSIGVGSPKKLVPLKENEEILLNLSENYRKWKIRYVPTVCTPIERCPKSEKEIVEKTNIVKAYNTFDEKFWLLIGKMKERIDIETIERVLKKYLGKERMLSDFVTMKELLFIRKYYLS